MKWKFDLGLMIFACGYWVSQVGAQTFSQSMQQMGSEAVEGYLQPMAEGMGSGMNSQWYYSSKTQSFLGLPVGFSLYVGYPLVGVSKSMKTFDFSGNLPVGALISQFDLPISLDSMEQVVSLASGDRKDYNLKTLNITAEDVPTIYGSSQKSARTRSLENLVSNSDEDNILTLFDDYNKVVGECLASDSNGTACPDSVKIPSSVLLPFVGFGWSVAPSLPPLGLNIGISHIPVLDNISLGVRYMSSSLIPGSVGDVFEKKLGTVSQFGFTVQHEITPHIPIMGKLPFLHFGLMYAYNAFTIDAKKYAKLESDNQVYMFTTSLDAKFLIGLGVYGGIGYETSSITVDTKATTLNIPTADGDTVSYAIDKYHLVVDGHKGLRTQVGLRVSLAAFDIYADLDHGSTTTYNLGIAIGLNGL
ncbi:MAG TPA: DUF6588 family protein [Fibrobacteraceae bacterium]|nr:DUF6588 family protein [Fibrobacteraceae bacterium]